MPLLPTGKLPADLLQAVLDKHAAATIRGCSWARGWARTPPSSTSATAISWPPPIRSRSPPTSSAGTRCTSTPTTSPCAGRRPRWFLATLLLPGRTRPTTEQVRSALRPARRGVRGARGRAGGRPHRGHARASTGPIVAGTMLGEVAKDRLVTTGGAQVGDAHRADQGRAAGGRGHHRAREGGRGCSPAASDRR